jgi:hypothetical protein
MKIQDLFIKTTVFRNIERFVAFLTFKLSKSIHCPFKTFFSVNMANGVLKNLSFHTDFKNINFIFVKSAPKISFSPEKPVFEQNIFWVDFLLMSNVHF